MESQGPANTDILSSCSWPNVRIVVVEIAAVVFFGVIRHECGQASCERAYDRRVIVRLNWITNRALASL